MARVATVRDPQLDIATQDGPFSLRAPLRAHSCA